MSAIRVTGPGDGEVALSGPVSLRILEDGGTTAHRLGIAEIVLAPRTEGPPQHRHGDPGDEPAVVLNTFTPDLYLGYFRELRDQVAAGRPLSEELIGETMRRYATSS